MSKFAIIQIGPFQYNVEEGKEYTVQKFVHDSNELKLDNVLAVGENNDLKLGKPFLDGVNVVLEILGDGKGEKINSRIFKAKSRYRRNRGIRKQVTKFKVSSINLSAKG